jgi:hypothetical protein
VERFIARERIRRLRNRLEAEVSGEARAALVRQIAEAEARLVSLDAIDAGRLPRSRKVDEGPHSHVG